MNFTYGNKVLRAVPEAKEDGRRTLWFPAKDLEAITGLKVSTTHLTRDFDMRPGIDFKIINTKTDEGFSVIHTRTSKGGSPKRIVLSDSGLFQVIYGGRTKFAKEFKHWITDEVWPALLHDGAYITPDGHPMQDVVDEVKRLTVRIDELQTQYEMVTLENKVLWEHADLRLRDLANGV